MPKQGTAAGGEIRPENAATNAAEEMAERMDTDERQFLAFEQARNKLRSAEKPRIQLNTLYKGAVLTINKHPMEVVAIDYDEDTHEPQAWTLVQDVRDGDDYGVQVVGTDFKLYADASLPERPDTGEAFMAKPSLQGKKPSAQHADLQSQAAWMGDTARALGYADADELATKDPQKFQKMAAQWRVKHARDTEGKFVQTEAIRGIFSTLYGSKNTKARWIDESGQSPRRFAAEAETHTRGEIRANEAGPESPTTESVRAGKARLIGWARDAGLLLSKLPEAFTPYSAADGGGSVVAPVETRAASQWLAACRSRCANRGARSAWPSMPGSGECAGRRGCGGWR